MNGLAIDCAVSRLTTAAKNDDKVFISVYDIGMKQSETIVPGIELALAKAGLEKKDLNYLTLTAGPGSFTGLRLAISALKALEMVLNIPLYGISSLEAYGYAYKNLGIATASLIDANKDKFYARITDGKNKIVLQDGDHEVSELVKILKKMKTVFLAGPDALKFQEIMKTQCKKTKTMALAFEPNAVEALFAITEEKIKNNEPPLKDFDGPVYLRASEAELKLNK